MYMSIFKYIYSNTAYVYKYVYIYIYIHTYGGFHSHAGTLKCLVYKGKSHLTEIPAAPHSDTCHRFFCWNASGFFDLTLGH